MDSTEHYLEEFNIAENRNKWLHAAIISISLYLAYLVLDIFIEFTNFSMSTPVFEWEIIAITILLPFAGCVLLYRKKLFGWILCYAYFSLFSFALSIGWIMKFSESMELTIYSYHPFILTVLSIASFVFLVTPALRQALKIRLWLWITITGLSLIVALLLVD